uniref:Uncharacterized protein n=1 Tax=Glycine max TaxID=3847 RepID=C6T139_SOYBN|nr:unknown [Glycine max]
MAFEIIQSHKSWTPRNHIIILDRPQPRPHRLVGWIDEPWMCAYVT